MSLKTYALAVSFASLIGLLVTITPLTRSGLEYLSPGNLDLRPELASLEVYVLAKGRGGLTDEMWAARTRGHLYGYLLTLWDKAEWQAMYDAARNQQIQASHSKAARDVSAYGILAIFCLGMLVLHLAWARHLASRELQ
jgi:hypothetical protein